MQWDDTHVRRWTVLDGAQIRASLKKDLPFQLIFRDTTKSTNEEIKQAISAGEHEGLVVTSLEQKGGYGRQGRSWASPLGGLYLSLLLRPTMQEKLPSPLPTLSLLVSIAVRRTLISCGVVEPIMIKWPNDVLTQGGKLCGISVEAIDDAVCVGIGINIFRPLDVPNPEGKHRLAYLIDILDDPSQETDVSTQGLSGAQLSYMEEVTAVLLNEVASVYNQWLVEGFSPFRDEYRINASLQGRAVQLVSLANNVLHEGVVCDVDENGCLCLINADGSITHAHSGEVHVR